MKHGACFGLGLLALVALSGCQSSKTLVNSYKVFQSPKPDLTTLYLSCEAAQGCEFAKIDDVKIIDERTKLPSKEAIDRGWIRLAGTLFTFDHQYGLSLISGTHDVTVRFYPVTSARAESFHLIHNFSSGHHYNLVMYRQKNTSKKGSLLNVAMPSGLCVDLQQDYVTIRHFCRPYDALTGLGEFVEQKS